MFIVQRLVEAPFGLAEASGERGQTDIRTYRCMDRSPLCFTGHCPPLGPLPKKVSLGPKNIDYYIECPLYPMTSYRGPTVRPNKIRMIP